MRTRRRFIALVPFAGAGLLAACSPPAPAPSPSSATSPGPAPSPAPAPEVTPPSSASMPSGEAGSSGAPTGGAAGGGSSAQVDPNEPTAKSLGYVTVASQADRSRFPKYAAGQACFNCALYGGKAGSETGPCPLFGNRQVAATGWCSSHVAKPA